MGSEAVPDLTEALQAGDERVSRRAVAVLSRIGTPAVPALADALSAPKPRHPGRLVRALERMKDRTGTYVLAGAAADAVSYEATRYGQGLLTYGLLFRMRGPALRQ